jgi:hypothetical protein
MHAVLGTYFGECGWTRTKILGTNVCEVWDNQSNRASVHA